MQHRFLERAFEQERHQNGNGQEVQCAYGLRQRELLDQDIHQVR